MTQTAGWVLKKTRQQQNRSLKSISSQTKIKEKFLLALEENDWSNLPEIAITQGFARNFAQAVGANTQLIAALLRRDYPISKTTQKFSETSLDKISIWTPKMTIYSALVITLLILTIYLFNQYRLFTSSPYLKIENIKISEDLILVSGKTIPNATVEVNNKSVLIEEDGKFSIEIKKQDLLNSQVVVESTSRSGKTTIIRKQVP